MVALSFTLDQDGCSRLYDALACLAKINEVLTVEARNDQLNLSVLNSTKSAYVSFALDRKQFFTSYNFSPDEHQRTDRFAFQILNRALALVFKGKLNDARSSDTGLERCVVSLRDRRDSTVCRLIIQMVHRNGVTKTHRFTYEAVEAMHALFDASRATNKWRAHARLLREYTEFFGARTEQLDMFSEEDRFTFTSYTEKIVNGKDVLKQPLQTAVSIDTQDFEEFDVTDNLHIAINVTDFKTMVMHASSLNTFVTAMYSVPSRPLQFIYSIEGMRCEFTLTTIGGELRSVPAPNPGAARNISRQSQSRAGSVANNPAPSLNARTSSQQEMPPPSVPASRLSAHRSARLGSNSNNLGPQRSAIIDNDPDSLFLPDDPEDEDRRWNPAEEQNDDDQDMLGWAPSAQEDDLSHGTFQDISTAARPSSRRSTSVAENFIAPTQRASDVRGIFDD